MRIRTVGLLALLVFLITAGSGRALAEEAAKPDFAAAKKHFKAGQAFMQMDRFADAVVEFKQAYEITGDGLVMGQVALAYEKGGDYEAALEAVKVYRDALPEGERASAEALIKKYERLIAEGKSKPLTLPTDEAPADEGAEAGADEGIEEEGGETAPPMEGPEEDKPKRFYTWIAAGAAGALAVSALVLGLNAQSKYDDLSENCSPNCSASQVDSVETRALATDILWGTAAAAAITAGVLYFLEGRSEQEPAPEEEEYEFSRVHVAPVMGKGSYGLGANISF